MILHSASQHYAADHRRCLKYGFFPVSTPSGENVLSACSQATFQMGRGLRRARTQVSSHFCDEFIDGWRARQTCRGSNGASQPGHYA
jgi:hypothetical protein